MIAGMTNIDVALLNSEWVKHGNDFGDWYECPSCNGDVETYRHEPGCPHDLALSERGYPTHRERDEARARLAAGSGPTIPPPPPQSPAAMCCAGCGVAGFGPGVQGGQGPALHWVVRGAYVCLDCYRKEKP